MILKYLRKRTLSMRPDENLFITKWVNTVEEPIVIPTRGLGYNYSVDWSYDVVDGFNAESVNQTGDATSPVLPIGEYTVAITGAFPRIYCFQSPSALKLIEIIQWGTNPWTSMYVAFYGCINLTMTNPDVGVPDLSNAVNMDRTFFNCQNFNGDVSNWDVSTINNLNYCFYRCFVFNQDLDLWDVSNVTRMFRTFADCRIFNGNIDNWNTSNVTDMQQTFDKCYEFNRDIGNWDVSKVTRMRYTFRSCYIFNQDISSWNVGNVVNMYAMFYVARKFNQDIGGWDVSKVEDMGYMLGSCLDFDQDLSGWQVSQVTTLFNFMINGNLSTMNYDSLLVGWGSQTLTPLVVANFGNAKFTPTVYAGSPASYRDLMILAQPLGYEWDLTDGGPA